MIVGATAASLSVTVVVLFVRLVGPALLVSLSVERRRHRRAGNAASTGVNSKPRTSLVSVAAVPVSVYSPAVPLSPVPLSVPGPAYVIVSVSLAVPPVFRSLIVTNPNGAIGVSNVVV